MRKILVLFILFVIQGCAPSIPRDYIKMSSDPDEVFYKKTDDIKQVTFIKHKMFFISFYQKEFGSDFPLEAYIVKSETSQYVRMKFRYTGGDWIFFDKIIIMNSANQSRMEWQIKTYDKTTNVFSDPMLGSRVNEEIDLLLSDDDSKKLNDIFSNPGEIKLRLTGKYYSDFTIEQSIRNAMIKTLNYIHES